MSTQSQEEFWSEVQVEREKLGAGLLKKEFPGQPAYMERKKVNLGRGRTNDNNVVWLTSILNRVRGTYPGHVVEMTVQLAGQRIVEQTHVVSTKDDIKGALDEREATRKDIEQAEIKKKMQFVSNVGEVSRSLQPGQPTPADT